MSQAVVIVIRVDDEGTEAIGAAGDALGAMGGQAEDAGKGLGKASGKSAMLGKAMGVAKVGIAAAAAAGAALIGVLVGVAKGAQASIDAFAEQDKVNRDVAESLARAGLEGEALNAKYQELQATASSLAGQTLFGDEDILAAMARYGELTGEASASTAQLDVILGIAEKRQIDASAAAEKYAKAKKGEVEALKELTPLTKLEAEQLNKMTDQAKKAALAEEILAASFAGAATNISGTVNATKNLEDAKGDLLQKIGEVLEASGVVPVFMNKVTQVFRFAEGAINDNAEAIQHWVINGIDRALGGLVGLLTVLEANVEYVGSSITTIKLFGQALQIVGEVGVFLINTLGLLVTSALSGLLTGIDAVVSAAADAAEAVGQDGLASSLRIASDTASGMADSLDNLSRGAVDNLAASAGRLDEDFGAMGDTILGADKDVALAAKGLDATRETIEGVRGEIQGLAKDVTGLGNAPDVGAVRQVSPADTDELGKQVDKEAEKRREKERQAKLAAEIAGLELQALFEQDAQVKAVLGYQMAQLEVRRQGLEGIHEELALGQAAVELETKLSDIEQGRLDTLEAQAEARREAHEEALEQLDAEIAKQNELWSAVGAGISGLNSGMSQMDALADLLGETASATGDIAAEIERMSAGLVEGAGASAAALSTTGGAAATFADQMGASAKAQAGILALFQTAAAIAAFAVGNIPTGVQHSIAAATYAAVAATSAGASASPRAASSAGAGAGRQTRSSRLEGERSSDLSRGSLSRGVGGASSVVVYYDQRGSINGRPTPEMQRQVATASIGGMRQKGMEPERLRSRRSR